ncbi:alpha/beta hydrolase [Nocardioides mesophilus]|uniref:alpha/beta hydrolase n=1 Tax=Nocardioides mesophilus TaxID=433659 RepID=UPI001FE8C553|nr:alpha/beta hydrolase [Nocardioides mesophilus]
MGLHGGSGSSPRAEHQARGGRPTRGAAVRRRAPDEPLDVDVLIDDFEAVREHLGIEAWAVLGHSAGGGYALRYALRCPESVRAVVFDCPCWDGDLTDRLRLPVVAARLEEAGKVEAAAACRHLAAKPGRITAADESRLVMQELDESYLDLFFHTPESARAFEELMESAGFTEQQWARGMSHQPLLDAMYQPQVHLLAGLRVPSLLVHGRSDLVVPPEVVETYRTEVARGAVHTFAGSGHFAYHEEPEEYAGVIASFVREHAS